MKGGDGGGGGASSEAATYIGGRSFRSIFPLRENMNVGEEITEPEVIKLCVKCLKNKAADNL